jgi:hypothetical protein
MYAIIHNKQQYTLVSKSVSKSDKSSNSKKSGNPTNVQLLKQRLKSAEWAEWDVTDWGRPPVLSLSDDENSEADDNVSSWSGSDADTEVNHLLLVLTYFRLREGGRERRGRWARVHVALNKLDNSSVYLMHLHT